MRANPLRFTRLEPAAGPGHVGAARMGSRSPAAACLRRLAGMAGTQHGLLRLSPGRRCPAGCRRRARWTSAPPAKPAPVDAAKPGCLARGAPCRRAARPPQRSWQAAGGSEDVGPAPLGSNYLPAASGPNPLTRRARSRLAKQGSIRLKCEVRISRKNESVVIAPALPPGRRSPAAAPSLPPALRPAGLLLGRLRLPRFVCLSGLPTGKRCRTVLLGCPAKCWAGQHAGGLAPAAEPLPAPREPWQPRAWLLAEAPRGPAAVGQGMLAARRAGAGGTSRSATDIAPTAIVHGVEQGQRGIRSKQGSLQNLSP